METPSAHGDVGGPTTDVLSSRLQRTLLTSVVVAWSDIQTWAELQGERLPEHYLPEGTGVYHHWVI